MTYCNEYPSLLQVFSKYHVLSSWGIFLNSTAVITIRARTRPRQSDKLRAHNAYRKKRQNSWNIGSEKCRTVLQPPTLPHAALQVEKVTALHLSSPDATAKLGCLKWPG